MRTLIAALGLSFLVACGGGGGGAAGAAQSDPPPASNTTPVAEAPVGNPLPPTEKPTGSIPPVVIETPTLTVRAHGSLAANVGPLMEIRVNGTSLGSVEVRSLEPRDYVFDAPNLVAGARVDIVYGNDAAAAGEDRNLHITYIRSGSTVVLPSSPGVVIDNGVGAAAFDGVNTIPGQTTMWANGAMRLTWAAIAAADPALQDRRVAASRFLEQASFGPTLSEIDRVATIGTAAWLDEQMAMPASAGYVSHIDAKFARGVEWRPLGSEYSPIWLTERFWSLAAKAPDQLRRRVAYALHQMLVVSLNDSNVHLHGRAYASYLDMLDRNAFGNYRVLLEEMALSPAVGLYLSHLRNRPEDLASGRQPDENFARELMQLFSIGLTELNLDGSARLDANGRVIETYGNADVMALAKVFTGWSWALPDNQSSLADFLWGVPDYRAAIDARIDVNRMRSFVGQHALTEKRFFASKPQQTVIAANTNASESLRLALDALFNHPNVGPFVGRQLIQRLVTSEPSPAYVARVATVFNNNGRGVRGDLAAVVRAILNDAEARSASAPASFGKLVEPVMRVTRWMRAFEVNSASGEFKMAYELDAQMQRPLYASSVFGYFRPGYVPPNTAFSNRGATAPEFQIVNESSVAAWVNLAESMSGDGLGWTTSSRDVSSSYTSLTTLAASGDVTALVARLNLLLYAGRMSAPLQQTVLEVISSIDGRDSASQLYRARAAVFMALASPEFLVQR